MRSEALKNEIAGKADELAVLTLQQAGIKDRIEELKAWFEKLAVEELRDTKSKAIEYWGSGNARVVVSSAESVSLVSVTPVEKVLGGILPDYVKQETVLKMTEPAKRLFAAMYLGQYTEGSLELTVKSISQDPKIQRALRKKLKGKYLKDTETLVKTAGLPEQEASDWAYLTAEIINWEWILQVLHAADWKGTPEEAVGIIRSAVMVKESLKVTVQTGEN